MNSVYFSYCSGKGFANRFDQQTVLFYAFSFLTFSVLLAFQFCAFAFGAFAFCAFPFCAFCVSLAFAFEDAFVFWLHRNKCVEHCVLRSVVETTLIHICCVFATAFQNSGFCVSAVPLRSAHDDGR